MYTSPTLTESIIRDLTTPQSFSRGRDYYRAGAVLHLEQRKNTLAAEVEGSQYKPYRVTVTLDAGGVTQSTCTCEYEWGGVCKHVVAVLLAYMAEPERIEQRPAVDTLLDGLDRETLLDLVQSLLNRQPELVEWVEGRLALRRQPETSTHPSSALRQRVTPLNTDLLRRGIRQTKKAFDYDDHHRINDSDLMQTLRESLTQAAQFVEGGDHGGLDILTVLAEETVDDWADYDHDGDAFSLFFEDLGRLLTEALLTVELSQQERDAWADRITQWQGQLEDEYGLEIATFDAAIGAAKQGWDDEVLLRALRGETTEHGAWKGERPWYAATLTEVRLAVLARQGRTEEYLNLARAEGQSACYVIMLIKLGRAQEALDYGLHHLKTADDALSVAQTFREQMRPADALRIAEQGLTLGGRKSELARWLRNFAAAQGKPETALWAARMVFSEWPTLVDYQAVQALAGDVWPALKSELLAELATKDILGQRIDIYLYEQQVDDAIQLVENQPFIDYMTVEKVVDAALTLRPEWAIRQCRKQAEPIMNGAKSSAYTHALRWLEKARRAHVAMGHTAEWQQYLGALMERHRRKYALMPGLQLLSIDGRQKR